MATEPIVRYESRHQYLRRVLPDKAPPPSHHEVRQFPIVDWFSTPFFENRAGKFYRVTFIGAFGAGRGQGGLKVLRRYPSVSQKRLYVTETADNQL